MTRWRHDVNGAMDSGTRRGGIDTGEIMAILSVTQDKLAQALSILQILAPKLDDIYNGQVSLRQNVADLLVGAGIPDSVAAQVDALLLAAQLDQSKVNAALALLGQPLPPPSTGGTNPPPPAGPPSRSQSTSSLARHPGPFSSRLQWSTLTTKW
jgi:hypothetical protein